jgi:hypothetical protein
VTAAAVGAGEACPTDSPRTRACNEDACAFNPADGAVLEATLDLASLGLGGPFPSDPAALQARYAAGVAAALGVPVSRVDIVGAARVQVPFALREGGEEDGATLRPDGRRAAQDTALERVAVQYKLAAAEAFLAVPNAALAPQTRRLREGYML